MSTGFECEIMEYQPGKWYYVLQNWDCPVGADNWREWADCYGPFSSEDQANDHLHDHHANPGGYTSYPFPSAGKTEQLDRLVAGASK